MTLDPAAVHAAAADWVWVPEHARERRTEEFHLVAYPEWFADPTMALRLRSARSAADLVDDVLAAARELGRSGVTFAGLSDSTVPADLEQHLRDRGARPVEELAVLALDLTAGGAELDVPPDVEVRPLADLPTFRDFEDVSTEVFGGRRRRDEELAAELPRVAEEDPPRWVAYRSGRALGAAGQTVAFDVLRLWGGCVLPDARRTGVYRALLAHRLDVGVARGCRMALVRGRVDTSAPILGRAGFRRYGSERSWHLAPGG